MIAVDTNILVHAHRRDSELHASAKERIGQLARGSASWAIPWPCLHEFYSVVTHPRIFDPPSTPAEAIEQVRVWVEAPSASVLTESRNHLAALESLVVSAAVTGGQIHDARIAAICLSNGVSELVTLDRDFSRYPQLRTRGLPT